MQTQCQSLLLAFTVIALLSTTAPQAHAEVIGTDTFVYPDGSIADQAGGAGWDWDNVATTHTGTASDWDILSGAPSVSGGRLQIVDGSVKREFNGPTEGLGADGEELGAYKGTGTLYFRVDLTRDADVTWSGISSYELGSERVFFGVLSTEFEVREAGQSGTSTGVTPVPGQTYTLVGKLDFDDDAISVWLDPDLGAAEGTPNATETYTGSNWSTAVRLGSGGAGITTWENLIIADEWQDLRRIVVTTVADEDDGNLDPATAPGSGTSLREAVNHASSGSLITFAPSLNGKTITLTSAELTIDKTLTIDASSILEGVVDGGSDGDLVQEAGEFRCLEIFSSASTPIKVALKNLTLRNGFGNLSITGEVVTLTRCRILQGVGFNGGGITANGTGSELTLDTCVVSGNSATNGGGIYFSRGTSLTITDTLITNNAAGVNGGGIYHLGGDLRCISSTFSNNQTGTAGGGLYSRPNLSTSTSFDAMISHCSFVGNSSSSDGGGVFHDEGQATFTHCTITGNTAPANKGNGLSIPLETGNPIKVQACVISGNTHRDMHFHNTADLNAMESLGDNLLGPFLGDSVLFTAAGDQRNISDPGLTGLDDFGGPTLTLLPLPGSPLLDAASGSSSTTDQRGLAVFGGTRDIGATEYQGNPDFALVWATDQDHDGHPYGMERALGTDPKISDAASAQNPSLLLNDSGESVITFGHEPEVSPLADWVLTRSTTLTDYGVELYRYNGTTETFSNGASGGLSNGVFTIIDPAAVGETRFFYRFEADLR